MSDNITNKKPGQPQSFKPKMTSLEVKLKEPSTEISLKQPSRLVYFSDGVLEEFSDDDDSGFRPDTTVKYFDLEAESERHWVVNKCINTAKTTLGVCDYFGETLANFFGITTPKYQYEIEESKRQEEERASHLEKKSKGWVAAPAPGSNNEILTQPEPSRTYQESNV